MPVVTVRGEVSENDLGVTDIHEHILCDFSRNFELGVKDMDRELANQDVSIANLGAVTQNPLAVKDNLILSNRDAALEELSFFKRAGGRTIVDPTTEELGRDPEALKYISEVLDIHIVTCTGHYIQSYHDSSLAGRTVESIYEQMMKEISVGIAESGIRAGVIGELGTSEIIYEEEARVLTAAAMVNRTTGAPIMVHTDPQSRRAVEAIKILEKGGADLKKVSICHMDSNFFEEDYYHDILATGAYIEFDTFGEHFCLHPNYGPSDLDRVKRVIKLLDEGYGRQIMLGNDVCLKCRLRLYGGWGYDHLLTNVIPAMHRLGASNDQIERMLMMNPREYLAFSS